MRRRFWPAMLVAAALVVFTSYLAYTHYLVQQIKAQAAVNSRIWSLVQRGLLASSEVATPDPDSLQAIRARLDSAGLPTLWPLVERGLTSEHSTGEELLALFEIQAQLDSLELPRLLRNEAGQYTSARDLPFEVDLGTPDGQQRADAFAAEIARRSPANIVEVPGRGAVIFGDPPLLAWLRWVPWLQVTGGLLLVLVTIAVIRSDLRAERERLWAAMARELAHQMGTPLSSLEGWLEVLNLPREEREAFASDQHIAQVMGTDVERLERVSHRFELIGRPPALDAVPVEDMVNDLCDYFVPRLPKMGRGVTLRARVEKGMKPLRANRVLLAWALENVVKNAVDALGGRGGRIMILAHSGEDGSVHVHIGDNGPGIPSALRERIFEPGITTKPGGWGVGLSLTRRIVQDLHGGRIAVRQRRGGGTVFDIRLPAEPA